MGKIIWKTDNEILLQKLRNRRKSECFVFINRGGLWYDTLTDNEKYEMLDWYEKWLEVTETLVVPETPNWLK